MFDFLIYRNPGEEAGGDSQPDPSPEAAPEGGQDFGIDPDGDEYPDVGEKQNFRGYGDGEPDDEDGRPEGLPKNDGSEEAPEEADETETGEEEAPTAEDADQVVVGLQKQLDEANKKNETLSNDVRDYVGKLGQLGIVDEKGNVKQELLSRLKEPENEKTKSGEEDPVVQEVSVEALKEHIPDIAEDTAEILAKFTNFFMEQQRSRMSADVANQVRQGIETGKAENELESKQKVAQSKWVSFVNDPKMAKLLSTDEGKTVMKEAQNHAYDAILWATNPDRVTEDAMNYVTAKMAGKIVTEDGHRMRAELEEKVEKKVLQKPIPAGGGDKPVSTTDMNKRRKSITSSSTNTSPIQQFVKRSQGRPMYGGG